MPGHVRKAGNRTSCIIIIITYVGVKFEQNERLMSITPEMTFVLSSGLDLGQATDTCLCLCHQPASFGIAPHKEAVMLFGREVMAAYR